MSQCPPSLWLSSQAPPAITGYDAAYGTAAHAIFERCLQEGLDTFEVRRQTITVDGHEIEVEDAMLEGIQVALDWCRENLEPPIIVEQRVELGFAAEILGEPMGGYIDAAAMRPVPTVADLKTGFFVVESDAPQLKLYLIGFLIDQLGELPTGPGVVGRTVVLQPNAQAEPVRISEHTGDDLRAFAAEVVETMRRVKRKDFTYKSGSHCKFCPAIGVCPHLAAVARDAALARITPSPELVASGEFSSELLEEALDLVPALDAWCKAVTKTAEDYLLHGGKLNKWKLVRKRTVRRWVGTEPETAAALAALSIDPYQHSIVTPAEAERRLPPSKRVAVKDMAEKPPGDLTLARADDARPVVDVGAAFEVALQSSMAGRMLANSRKRMNDDGT